MKYSFALYETLRRLLLLIVGVGVLGLLLAPGEDSADFSNSVAATRTLETTAAEPVPQKTLRG